ncbi:dATP/dGTP pyrophosphohydrolase domain-containing protein [Nakamurella leprariae]|uniref:DUF550 domain-containing protein n=1 Tax=Nakamurella leprariae TaxID=2803911 RepID=A0A938YGA7_9ACTN|nr:dATP/dGTP pyrophosphohydrolase domain-containing protein [Nakamurella leprariae]MBM9467285.1 DUF550 domain-containing protein [Nakamurella leprariae]
MGDPTNFVEANALLAAQAEDYDEARRIIGAMLPGERSELAHAARYVAALCLRENDRAGWAAANPSMGHNPGFTAVIEPSDPMTWSVPVTEPEPPAWSFAEHLQRQSDFSQRTFGPGLRTAGLIDHITKELAELAAEPEDMSERIDLVILALDGALRLAHYRGDPVTAVIDALVAKQERNEARTWPDWRTAPEGKAIEHDRSVPVTEPAPVITPGATPWSICCCFHCGPPWRKDPLWESDNHPRGSWMALCPTCGSKRCRGASDHRTGCDAVEQQEEAALLDLTKPAPAAEPIGWVVVDRDLDLVYGNIFTDLDRARDHADEPGYRLYTLVPLTDQEADR